MILYLDTSALVKKYFMEQGSAEVISLWQKTTGILTSEVAYAESMAAFFRKRREARIAAKVFNNVLNTFETDYEGFFRIQVNAQLNGIIRHLIAHLPLRGFDAIHLASALLVRERIRDEFLFVCFDQALLDAAAARGLRTFPDRIAPP